MKTGFNWRQALQSTAPLIVLILMFCAISAVQPAFLTGRGPFILLDQATPILVLALGQSIVLMTGSIDLSNAALTVLAGVLVASGLGELGAAAPLFTIASLALAGALNGVLIAVFQVPSFAVTLGMLGFWQSVALMITRQETLYVSKNGEVLFWLVDSRFLGIQPTLLVALVATFIIWALVQHTRFGTSLRATGNNELGAIMSGINVTQVKVLAFTLSGICAAIAGILIVSNQGAASASGLGNGLLLPAIAASILGGVAISGGVGNPINVVFGSLTVALIPIGSVIMGFDPKLQQIVFGTVLIAAVAFTNRRLVSTT